MNVINYFNPFSEGFIQSTHRFKELSVLRQISVIALSALAGIATFLALVLGSIGAFRYLVKKLETENLPRDVANANKVGTKTLGTPARQTARTETHVQGSRTQYDPKYNGKGRSACTYICVEAAEKLMRLSTLEELPEYIDRILDQGVKDYEERNDSTTEHASIEEINFEKKGVERVDFHDPFSLEWDPYSGLVNNFAPLIKDAASQIQFPHALVITKAPETIVVVCHAPNQFWLFDSHGKNGGHAYVEQYDSQEAMSKALMEKFPYFLPENPQEAELIDLTYNAYNAYALSLKSE